LEELYARYRGEVSFLCIYVREAHPTDGWRLPSNDKIGISIAQPKSSKERCAVADRCAASLSITMPLLVDDLKDTVGQLYSGMPDRMYVIDRDGKVTYRGARGPFGFKPREMEQSLAFTLVAGSDLPKKKAAPSEAKPAGK
jgi:hypothetical protein